MISLRTLSDCFSGYLAPSHWNFVMYVCMSSENRIVIYERADVLTVSNGKVVDKLVPLLLENLGKVLNELSRCS